MTNTKKAIQSLCILFIFLVINGCQNPPSAQPRTRTETYSTTFPQHERYRSDFDFLEIGISYEEVLDHVGKEDIDIGSGSYIMEYNLADGSKVYLQFISLNSLERAYIVYSDGQIEDIIEP